MIVQGERANANANAHGSRTLHSRPLPNAAPRGLIGILEEGHSTDSPSCWTIQHLIQQRQSPRSMTQFTIPAEIPFHREIIDEGFPRAIRPIIGEPGSIDLDFFVYIWADFTRWLDYPWVLEVNDEIEHDLERLLKLCQQANRFYLPRITLEKRRAHLIARGREHRRKHTRKKPTPHIARLRPIIDGSLAGIPDSDLKRMRNKFAKWLRGEFAPPMLIEQIEDQERLSRLQDEGRRRNLPDVYYESLFYLPTWKYWAEWYGALPCRPNKHSATIATLLDLHHLETRLFGRV